MKNQFNRIEYYPLEETYILCERYLNSRIDWDYSRAEIKKTGVAHFDISDVITLFPHLELDENYKLICYLGREYHGIYGRITAILNGDDIEPVFDEETERTSKLFHGKNFKLPAGANPPMEALYHDGTDDGLLEAILCSLFLQAIPYTHFQYRNRNFIMDNPPPDMPNRWENYVDINDWMPRRVNNSVIVLRRAVEDGFGASDGRDRIYLSQFNFERNLGMYHAVRADNRHSMYRSQIDDDKRYNDQRHCCVFTESSVLVARELDRY